MLVPGQSAGFVLLGLASLIAKLKVARVAQETVLVCLSRLSEPVHNRTKGLKSPRARHPDPSPGLIIGASTQRR
ncbi:uncharacterized protein LAJ45_02265 [Morchella importuna]|uniref:uncharacterized protein n=1 Tax=Morchella importuna TaxID=1174673 RepID=UPI001E8EC4F2|nr:uncharacterized protein LAJ45_02265 [Morchella importuna]KAH8153452.1 hypothetical protein LAJ45_02265 [Morchella importuna]